MTLTLEFIVVIAILQAFTVFFVGLIIFLDFRYADGPGGSPLARKISRIFRREQKPPTRGLPKPPPAPGEATSHDPQTVSR